MKVYKYLNEEDNSLSLTYPPPPKEASSSPPPLPSEDHSNAAQPPPPPPPEEEDIPRPPTSPAPVPPAHPLNGADHQLQDMDIEEDPNNVDDEGGTGNITDQLSRFYSEIGDVPDDDSVGVDSVPEDVSTASQGSAPNSPRPVSPINNLPKKKKKVKVSNNLSLKRKGVGDMLAKWQNIKN